MPPFLQNLALLAGVVLTVQVAAAQEQKPHNIVLFVPDGLRALSVTPESTSPFKYQWFAGHAGFTSTPIPGATSSTFTTPAINSSSEFWVRISDACGTIDSQTATLTPFD